MLERQAALRRLARCATATPLPWDGATGTGAAHLDGYSRSLVRLGALVANDASEASLQLVINDALATGVTPDGVVDALLVLLPEVGSARIGSAAPKVALALGFDIEDEPPSGPSGRVIPRAAPTRPEAIS